MKISKISMYRIMGVLPAAPPPNLLLKLARQTLIKCSLLASLHFV